MLRLIMELLDPKFLTTVFAAIAAAATVLTLAMPYLVNDTLSKRMKAVAFEREKIRLRERERLALGSRAALRQSPRAYMKTIVYFRSLLAISLCCASRALAAVIKVIAPPAGV